MRSVRRSSPKAKAALKLLCARGPGCRRGRSRGSDISAVASLVWVQAPGKPQTILVKIIIGDDRPGKAEALSKHPPPTSLGHECC